MIEIFAKNWWLVAIAEIAFVPLAGILCISLCVFTRKIRLARFDFELKLDMLQRGMSAEDIRTVIEAGRLKQDMLQRGMSAEEIHTVIEAGRPALPEAVATAPPRPVDYALQARVVPDIVVEEVPIHIGSRAT